MLTIIWLLGGLILISVLSFILHFLVFREVDRLEKIAEEYPGYADVRFKLGCIFHQRKKYKKATKYLEEAIKIYPYYLEAYKVLFETQAAMKDRKGARMTLKRLAHYAESQQEADLVSFAKSKLKEYENS